MKTIDTLVQDIYKLLGPEDSNLDQQKVDRQVSIFAQHVEQHIKTFLEEKPTYRKGLRLSGIGRPLRQLWYDSQCSDQPIPLDPSTRIKFLYGHILEELLILFSVLSGHEVTEAQKEVNVEGIKGHQDCKIDGVLVDCKSTSHRGFDKFKNCTLEDDDPFGYIEQISAYAEGNDVDEAAFLAINKQTGEICLTPVHSMEMINAGDKIKYLKEAMDTKEPPAKCYSDVPDGVSGNRKLAIGCIYCNHKKLCWQDANQGQGLRVFQYAAGYRYLTNVSKTPEVSEVLTW
jgi:hypothetical protein